MPHHPRLRLHNRQFIILAILALAIYVVVPQLGDLHSSWQLVRHPDNGWLVGLAIISTFVTYVAAALVYRLLAFRPLAFGRTLGVQLAAMFMNRLLPAGLGALGANYLYLRHEKHSVAQAGSVAAINNLLGFTGHGLLVAAGLLLYAGEAQSKWTAGTSQAMGRLLWIAGIAVIAIVVGLLVFGYSRFRRSLLIVKQQLGQYRTRRRALLAALGMSMILTVCNVLCFALCLASLGIELPFIVVMIIFTLGVGIATATPTPGGLGGFEAGLAAGLIANGLDVATAVAGALLYRLVSFWLPLLIGALAMLVCQRRGLFEPAKSSVR